MGRAPTAVFLQYLTDRLHHLLGLHGSHDLQTPCEVQGAHLTSQCALNFMFILVQFLALVIIGGFVYWFGCSLLYFFNIFLKHFFPFYPSFSSEPCG